MPAWGQIKAYLLYHLIGQKAPCWASMAVPACVTPSVLKEAFLRECK